MLHNNDFKICSKCKILKTLSNFNKRSDCKSGYKSHCKNCIKIYYQNNKDKIKNQVKIYQQKNKNELKYIAGELYSSAKRRSKKYNLPFNLTKSWILEQILKNPVCPILGTPFVVGKNKPEQTSRSLDRIYPELGYTKENTILVSYFVNAIKSNGTIEEIGTIINHLQYIKNLTNKTWKEKFEFLELKFQEIIYSGKYRRLNWKNMVYFDAKQRSKKNGIDFKLSKDNIVIPTHCPILEIPLFKGNEKQTSNSPSLDRIDNNLGYVPTNIQIISHKANTMKGSASLEELKIICNGYQKFFI